MPFDSKSGAYFQIEKDVQRKESTIRDGLFILLSLLLRFTLSLAASRFVERRSLPPEEAISTGTTYLGASTLPPSHRDYSKQMLQEYMDARLDMGNARVDANRFSEAVRRSKHVQDELWLDAAAVAQNDRTAITAVYINSLNETIDLHEKRVAADENRVPQPVWLLILCISVMRGATLPSRFWATLIVIPITIAIVVALVADLDSPSSGLIRLDRRATQRLKADMSVEPAK